jgi:ABC-type branched-subunit amino acid transport system ATPase component
MSLQLEGLARYYGGVRAVDGVSFNVERSSITALIGPNGAGKTTLLNIASGVTPPTLGRIRFDGRDITGKRPHEVCRAGIARTFQTPQLFPSMSVVENVLVGTTSHGHLNLFEVALGLTRPKRETGEYRSQALQTLRGLGIEHLADALLGSLPFGIQRLVEIARALAAQPKLVMMDEPASGLSRAETARLKEVIAQVVARGIAVLLVEHNMRLVMSIATRVIVLDKGRLLAAGSPSEVQTNAAVMQAYLGR